MLTFFFFPHKLSTPLCLPLITSSPSPPPLPLPKEWPKLWLDVTKNLVHLRKINPIVSGRFLQLAHIFPNFTLKSAFSLHNGQHQYYIYTCSIGGIMTVTGWKFYFENRKGNWYQDCWTALSPTLIAYRKRKQCQESTAKEQRLAI